MIINKNELDTSL